MPKNDFNEFVESTIPSSSVENALAVLSKNAIEAAMKAYIDSDKPGKKVGTTIRLAPGTNAFYRTLACNLGVSIQEAMSMTLNGAIQEQLAETNKT